MKDKKDKGDKMKKAFSLIELIFVIVIIVILSAIAIPRLADKSTTNTNTEFQSERDKAVQKHSGPKNSTRENW